MADYRLIAFFFFFSYGLLTFIIYRPRCHADVAITPLSSAVVAFIFFSASVKGTDGVSEGKYRLTQTDDGAVMSLDCDRDAISAGLFDDVLRIKASTGDRVDVFTVAGQKIYSTTASDNVVIATSAWQRGLYIIKVSSPYGTKTKKAIKR